MKKEFIKEGMEALYYPSADAKPIRTYIVNAPAWDEAAGAYTALIAGMVSVPVGHLQPVPCHWDEKKGTHLEHFPPGMIPFEFVGDASAFEVRYTPEIMRAANIDHHIARALASSIWVSMNDAWSDGYKAPDEQTVFER